MPLSNHNALNLASAFGLDSKDVTKAKLNDNFTLVVGDAQLVENRLEDSMYDTHASGILSGLEPSIPVYGGLSIDVTAGIALIGYSISLAATNIAISASMSPGYIYLRQDGIFHNAGATATPPTGIASVLYATYTSDGYDSLTVTLAARGVHYHEIDTGVAGAVSAGVIKTGSIRPDADFFLLGVQIVLANTGTYASTTVDVHAGPAGATPQTVFATQGNRPAIASLTAAYSVDVSGTPDTNRRIRAGYVYRVEVDNVATGATDLGVVLYGYYCDMN